MILHGRERATACWKRCGRRRHARFSITVCEAEKDSAPDYIF